MEGSVTEFFSLEDSPARPSLVPDDTGLLRDHYGFTVPPDYHELYRVYSPVWEQEETEREAHWCQFLSELAHLHADGGKFANIDDLCTNYLQEGVTIALHEQPGSLLHRPRLDALVKRGVPFTIRGNAWAIFLDIAVRKHRNYYNELVKLCLGDLQYRGSLELDEIRQQAAHAAEALQDAAALHGLPGYRADTEKDLATWRANSKVWLTQIEKDLPRTFPGLKLMEVSGRPALRRVLAAYSLHNSRVGYCQGLNFVVGTLLLFLDEEDAFWCLCALLDDILSGYYDVDMMAMQVDQRVFKRLVVEHFPQLSAYLEGLGADVSCVFVQWFLCVFVNFLPIEACLRVWDALFYYRSPTVLFKTALALMEVFSPALSVCSDVLDALDLLQTLAPLTYDSNRLIDLALGPAFEGVTDVRLATLRREYREEVIAEAAALADELAWEGSSTSTNGRSTATDPTGPFATHGSAASSLHSQQHQHHQPPPVQQQPSKMSMLKMLARGMKEKFTGVGGGGGGGGAPYSGSGTNSVERAASPAPPEPLVHSPLASGALGAAGGAAAAAATAAGNGAGGGSRRVTDEPLLVLSPQLLDGHGADADSEDYNRLTGDEAFQYEQVGYVAPSDLSESANAAVVVQHPGAAGREDRSAGAVAAAAAAGSSAAGPFTTAAAPAPAGTAKSAPPPAPSAVIDPLEALLAVVPETLDMVTSPSRSDDGRIRRNASSSYMWHETPKWTSMRAVSATGAMGPGAGGSWAAAGHRTTPAAASSSPSMTAPALAVHVEDGGGVAAAPVVPPLSPQALMLAADMSQSLLSPVLAPSLEAGITAGGVSPRLLPSSHSLGPVLVSGVGAETDPLLHPAGGVASRTASRTGGAAFGDGGAAVAVPSSDDTATTQGKPVMAQQAPPHSAPATGAAAAAPAGAAPAAPMIQVGSSTAAADFSQVQAADQARRAQGKAGQGRRCSRAAMMAWEIALEPLRARQQLQQQQQQGQGVQQQGQPPEATRAEGLSSQQQGQGQASQGQVREALQISHPDHYLVQPHPHQHQQQGAAGQQQNGAVPPPPPGSQAPEQVGADREVPRGPLGAGALQQQHHQTQTQQPSCNPPLPQPLPRQQGLISDAAPPPLGGAERSGASASAAAPTGALVADPAGLQTATAATAAGVLRPASSCPVGAAAIMGQQPVAQHQPGGAGAPAGMTGTRLQTPQGTRGGRVAVASRGDVEAPALPAGPDAGPQGDWMPVLGQPTGPQTGTHATAIPLAAGRSATRLGGTPGYPFPGPGQQNPAHPHAHAHHGLPGLGSGASLHPPPGSSVTSTGSMLVVDEHREASPAEARDEWVIMAAPGGPGEREGGRGGGGAGGGPPFGLSGRGGFATSALAPAVGQVVGGGGDQPLSRCQSGGSGRSHPAVTMSSYGNDGGGVAAGGSGVPAQAVWQSPGDLGPDAVQSMREYLGVHDLLLHHSALAQRLRNYQLDCVVRQQQASPYTHAQEGQQEQQRQQQQQDLEQQQRHPQGGGDATTEVSAGDSGAVGGEAPVPCTPQPQLPATRGSAGPRLSQLPLPLPHMGTVGQEAGSPDPSALNPALERLSQLEALLGDMLAAASGSSASSSTAAAAAGTTDATAAGTSAGTDGRTAATIPLPPPPEVVSLPVAPIAAAGGDIAGATGATTPLPEGALPVALTVPPPPPMPVATAAYSPLGQVVVGPGGQVMLQPLPPPPPPPVQTATPPPPPLASHPIQSRSLPGSEGSQPNTPAAATTGHVETTLETVSSSQQLLQPQQQHQQQSPQAEAPNTSPAPPPPPPQQQCQQDRLASAGALCAALRCDLTNSRQRCTEAADMLERYGVLSEVLAARLDELVRQLAEKQYTVDKLSSKLDQTMQKYAAQDTALADKDHAIRHLQHQLQGSTSAAAAAGGGSGAGGGGGGPISGLSSALGFGGGHLHNSGGTASNGGGGPGAFLRVGGGSGGGVGGGGGGASHQGASWQQQQGHYGAGAGGGGAGGGSSSSSSGFLAMAGGGGSGSQGGGIGGRPGSPQRTGNQTGLLWQFSKNLKAKFGSRDESDG